MSSPNSIPSVHVTDAGPGSERGSVTPTAPETATPTLPGASGPVGFFKRYSGWPLGGGGALPSPSAAPLDTRSSGSSSTLTAHLSSEPHAKGIHTLAMEDRQLEVPVMAEIPENTPMAQTEISLAGSEGDRSSPGGSATSDPRRLDVTLGVSGRPTHRRKISRLSSVQRPGQTHSFHTDATEVQYMEKSLLKLLDDFNSGKLRAFGQGCSMEKMEQIRDQQESLAKLHFELGARQDIFAPLSEDGLRTSNDNMEKLMERLEKLSMAIGQLNPNSNDVNTTINPESSRNKESESHLEVW